MFSQYDPTLSLSFLCDSRETKYLDRKSGRIRVKDLATHICGFSNADGGVIVIGIEDDGTISGVSIDQENEFRKGLVDFFQILPDVHIEAIDVAEESGTKRIMLFHIAPQEGPLTKLSQGEVFVRYGDATRKLNTERLLELEYSRGIRSFEDQIVADVTMNDLDSNLVQEYFDRLMPAVGDSRDLLRARNLVKEKNGKTYITVAAILLFCKTPSQFLPGARVRFLRYDGSIARTGTQLNIVKDIWIEKPLLQLIPELHLLVSFQMREFQFLNDSGRFESIPEYPEFTWLEGLVNAVTHRDYAIAGDHIRISMYDDRLEILSPGRLPGTVTVKNIRRTRCSRNPRIARVLNEFGWVRELNEGVNRMYIEMKSFFLEPPEFSMPNDNSVKLILRNNIEMRNSRKLEWLKKRLTMDVWNSLDELDQKIVFYIVNSSHCTTKNLIEITGRSRKTVQLHLNRLQEQKIIMNHSLSKQDPTQYYTVCE